MKGARRVSDKVAEERTLTEDRVSRLALEVEGECAKPKIAKMSACSQPGANLLLGTFRRIPE